ncbi:MAG: peptidylprolyl isomerase [Actinomycetota bacterium]
MGTEKRERQKQNRQQRLSELAVQQKRAKVKKRGLQFGIGIPGVILALFLIVNVFAGDDSGPSDDAIKEEIQALLGATTLPEGATDDATASTIPATTVPGKTISGDTACPKADGTEERVTKFEKAPPMCIDATKNYTAIFDTSEGEIEVLLDTAKTPKTVNNFVVLARYKYYDGTTIFRTDPSIDIIQGGGLTNTDDPGYTIEDEGNGYKYVEGDLAMARTMEPNSAGGQWFFVTGPNAAALDSQGTYVNFGKVASGLDVVKGILALNSGSGDLGGAPSRTVVVKSVAIIES